MTRGPLTSTGTTPLRTPKPEELPKEWTCLGIGHARGLSKPLYITRFYTIGR